MLPDPRFGEPTRRRPKNAGKQIAWVPTVLPPEITAEDGDPFRYGAVHIQQALSLVPDTVAGTEYRAISHAQIELIAAENA